MKKLLCCAIVLGLVFSVGCSKQKEVQDKQSETSQEQSGDIKQDVVDKVSAIDEEPEKEVDTSDDNVMKFESENMDFSNVSYQVSESNRNEKLEEAFIKVLEYDKEANGTLKYYYNKIDLNGDEKPETFLYLTGPYVSGIYLKH